MPDAHRILHVAAATLTAFSAATAWPQSTEYIDFRELRPAAFLPMGISADGTVVVGSLFRDTGDGWFRETRAARWSSAGGLTELGTLPVNRPATAPETRPPGSAVNSGASAVSANGAVIVGSSSAGDSAPFVGRAFRWTRQTGMVSLGALNGGGSSGASGVNADGSVIVGTADDGAAGMNARAFRWSQTGGMVSLGVLNGGHTSSASAVSADGSVIVGSAHDGQLQGGDVMRAFRWTQSTGVVSLGSLSGRDSFASDVSADGLVVVGHYLRPETRIGKDAQVPGPYTNHQAFRWTEAAGMEFLGTMRGLPNSSAAAVSADGSVIVGTVAGNLFSDPHYGFRWTRATGMQTIAEWLRQNGAAVPEAQGYPLATNADGSVVAGRTVGEDGFIARVSPAGTGFITLADMEQSLASSASGGAMLLNALGTVMNGANSRPLARRVASGANAFWVAGDWGRDDHGSRSGTVGLAEVGLGRNFGAAQLNVSVGESWARQDLALDGRAKTEGMYLLAQALVPVYGTLTATLGGYAGWGDSDIRRGYLNGGAPDFSAGAPDLKM